MDHRVGVPDGLADVVLDLSDDLFACLSEHHHIASGHVVTAEARRGLEQTSAIEDTILSQLRIFLSEAESHSQSSLANLSLASWTLP